MDVHESIRTTEDVMRMLDALFIDPEEQWDGFYSDRNRPIPFFGNLPDEGLKKHTDKGTIRPGRALDIGCGNGRNAIFLALRGFGVDAIDVSPKAIEWARERTKECGAEVGFSCASVIGFDPGPTPYDLVVDSGCFHHLLPHRRMGYASLVSRALGAGGHLLLTCFAPGRVGSPDDRTDWEVYRRRRMEGGCAFSMERLVSYFDPVGLVLVEMMEGRDSPPDSGTFGKAFLHTALFRKQP